MFRPALVLLLSSSALAAPPPAIDRLHAQDIAATLSGDPDVLAQLWTDDAVRIEPGEPPTVGRAAIHADDVKYRASHPAAKIVAYKPSFADVRVTGDIAFEWGTFDATFRESDGAAPASFRANVLRILRRQPDKTWRFAA